MPTRQIAPLDLASFKRPIIDGNPNLAVQILWYVVNVAIFRSQILGLLPSSIKVKTLRAFGATVGKGVVLKPRLDIKSPWFLNIGDHVWLGEKVWIDNHTEVKIGSNTCISQGAYLFTGNHDWNTPSFAFFCRPIVIGQGVWVAAFAKVKPGSEILDSVVFTSD